MKQRVFFIGAGFSKALCSGYPTLIQLSKSILTSFQNRYPNGAIREHLNQLPPGLVNNVEQLLSFLFSNWPWKSSIDKLLDKALYNALSYEISNCLTSIPAEPLTVENQQFIRFLGNVNNTIISLNYDTLVQQLFGQYSLPKGENYSGIRIYVEDVFDDEIKTTADNPWVIEDVKCESSAKMELVIRRDFIQKISPEEFERLVKSTGCANWSAYPPCNILSKYQNNNSLIKNESAIDDKILKLHGSISWQDEANNSTIRIQDVNGHINWERIPIIVPPVLDKSQHYAIDRLRNQWAEAHSKLEQADEVVIIGFSFPITDISCQFLFRSALKSRDNVRVVVVNIDKNIRGRYDEVFCELSGVNLDYSYSGREDTWDCYVRNEVLHAIR